MANQEHLKLFYQGATVWNRWRDEHPEIQPDLRGANLERADLRGFDLTGSLLGTTTKLNHITISLLSNIDLRTYRFLLTRKGINLDAIWLSGISPELDLSGLDLSKTVVWDPEEWEFDPSELESTFGNWQKWRDWEVCTSVNLSNVHLSGADVHEADWGLVDLTGADLSYADLHGIDLREADLHEANLQHANLTGAMLRDADLSHTDLSHADLSGADLSGTKLSYSNLSGADLSGIPWLLIMELTRQPGIVWEDVVYDGVTVEALTQESNPESKDDS